MLVNINCEILIWQNIFSSILPWHINYTISDFSPVKAVITFHIFLQLTRCYIILEGMNELENSVMPI